jgi:hypothetical protein
VLGKEATIAKIKIARLWLVSDEKKFIVFTVLLEISQRIEITSKISLGEGAAAAVSEADAS